MTVAAILLMGCADFFDAEESTENYSPSQHFYRQRAQIICKKNETCCAEVGIHTDSASKCFDRTSWERYGGWFDEDGEAGYITFNSDQADACLKTLASLSCNQWKSLIEGNQLKSCLAIYLAQQNEGEMCQHDEACTTRHCRQLPEVDGVRPGYGICDLRKSENEECYSSSEVSQDCDSGLICQSESIWSTDTCQPLLTEGERCTQNSQCYGDVCDSVTSACAPACQLNPDDRSKNILRHW